MATVKLKTPVSEHEIRKLQVNDVVYISGTVITARDQAHQRALDLFRQGKPLPIDFKDMAVYHCGPVMSKLDNGKWIAVAAGPTTSTRLEPYEEEFLADFGPRIIIGKGGMGRKTTKAMEKHGAVYCAFPGGAAVLAAQSIRKVEGVEWLDLGMPEAMWIFQVDMFGPLIIAIDSHGINKYDELAKKVEVNKQNIVKNFSRI